MPPRKLSRRKAAAGRSGRGTNGEERRASICLGGLAEVLGLSGAAVSIGELAERIAAQLDRKKDSVVADTLLPELKLALQQLGQKAGTLRQAAQERLEPRLLPKADGGRALGSASYVQMKVQVLLSYLIGLLYYMSLKARGEPVKKHPVVLRLLWLRSLLEKLRPVDQRLQYQMSKLLQWAEKGGNAISGTSINPHELKPGELAATVNQDEQDEEMGGASADAAGRRGRAYRPPKIAQVEYTGDHVRHQERAERDLERTKGRLERSSFIRSLREEFTDEPTEIQGEVQSEQAQRAARMQAAQQDFEEDRMVRVRGSKKEMREQQRFLRKNRGTSTGAVSLDDAVMEFRALSSSRGEALRAGSRAPRGRGRGRPGGTILEQYADATQRVTEARRVVASTQGGGQGRKRRRGG